MGYSKLQGHCRSRVKSGLVIMQAGEEGDIDPAFLSSRKSQKYGADLSAAAATSVRSGDADLPTKAPLHERRAKFDQVRLHCILALRGTL